MAVLHSTLHELVLELHHHGYLLLTHSLTQLVRLTLGEVRKLSGEKHHLLLVDRDSVGLLEELRHFGQVVGDGLLAEFPGDEVRDVVHRTRTVERIHRDEVSETLRMQFPQPLLHTRRFKLEHDGGVTAAVELVGLPVVLRDGLYVDVYPVPHLDVVQGLVYDGQGYEAQEVHLEHTHVLDVVPVVLGGPALLLGGLVLRKTDGYVVGEVTPADDGRAGVHSDLTYASLKLEGIVEHLLLKVGTVLEYVLELRHQTVAVLQVDLHAVLLQALLEEFLREHLLSRMLRVVHFDLLLDLLETGFELVQLRIERILLLDLLRKPVGHQLGQPHRIVDREMADSGHVLYGALCGHCAEGDDPGHMVCGILLLHIAVRRLEVLEIDVDIRHADTVRVQEALEQQGVLDRVQIGDFQAICHHGARSGTSSRPHQRTCRPGCRNIILDYEEVVRETHTAYGLELEVYPF